MIENIGKHYLYRHIRLDTGQPFYIGIGTKAKRNYKTITAEYYRAYSYAGTSRTEHWKRIVNKAGHEVEILLESDDYDFIKQKEIEFIALYRRVDCCDGILINLTDGGDGNSGWIMSEERKKKIADAQNNTPKGIDSPRAKKVINTQTKEIYKWAGEAYVFTNVALLRFSEYLSRTSNVKNPTYFMYLKDYEKYGAQEPWVVTPRCTEVIDTETMEIYPSIKEASKIIKKSYGHLSLMLSGKLKNTTNLTYKKSYDGQL